MINAAMAQLVEHILGKDEVPGPNPGSSSRQPQRSPSGALVFYVSFPSSTKRLGLSGAATLASLPGCNGTLQSGPHIPTKRRELAHVSES